MFTEDSSVEEIIQALTDSIDEVHRRDSTLLSDKAHEQTVSHRLALYLQNRVPEGSKLSVDCEYDRDGRVPKRSQRDGGKDAERPDIIVHGRGERGPNVLVVEVKKSDDAGREIKETRSKLRNWKRSYDYRLAVLVCFSVGDGARNSRIEVIHQERGQLVLIREEGIWRKYF